MRAAAVILGWLWLASGASALVINYDQGGQIDSYLMKWASVADRGERVVIDGECHSACTLILGVVPAAQMCVTPRARFGFHRAYTLDDDGRRHDNAFGTSALMRYYPAAVRQWINRHGGLTIKLKIMPGKSSGLRACNGSTR